MAANVFTDSSRPLYVCLNLMNKRSTEAFNLKKTVENLRKTNVEYRLEIIKCMYLAYLQSYFNYKKTDETDTKTLISILKELMNYKPIPDNSLEYFIRESKNEPPEIRTLLEQLKPV